MNTEQNSRNDRLTSAMSPALLMDSLSVACDRIQRRLQQRWHRIHAATRRVVSPSNERTSDSMSNSSRPHES
jgi:hypothetical protein